MNFYEFMDRVAIVLGYFLLGAGASAIIITTISATLNWWLKHFNFYHKFLLWAKDYYIEKRKKRDGYYDES